MVPTAIVVVVCVFYCLPPSLSSPSFDEYPSRCFFHMFSRFFSHLIDGSSALAAVFVIMSPSWIFFFDFADFASSIFLPLSLCLFFLPLLLIETIFFRTTIFIDFVSFKVNFICLFGQVCVCVCETDSNRCVAPTLLADWARCVCVCVCVCVCNTCIYFDNLKV